MSYAHRLEGDRRIKLKDFDPGDKAGLKREEGEKKTAEIIAELVELQELLYAAQQQSMLVILQGRDTSGKDELAHDFLWRIHKQTPETGHIKVFNRSHYEDVLVVRVHNIVPEEVWRSRYEHINAFERLLADSNAVILKFYLHISKEEQEQRLLEREKDSVKSWKLSVSDWKEREYWDDYTAVYEDMLNRCSAKHAPWFIVPADKKWFRNLAIAETMRDAMVPFKKKWLEKLEEIGREKKRAIEEYRRGGKH
jgi:polyphosphate kinase 2 (PPK2 family)